MDLENYSAYNENSGSPLADDAAAYPSGEDGGENGLWNQNGAQNLFYTGEEARPVSALGKPRDTAEIQKYGLFDRIGILGIQPETDENGEMYFNVRGRKYGAKINYDPEADIFYYGPDLEAPLDADRESVPEDLRGNGSGNLGKKKAEDKAGGLAAKAAEAEQEAIQKLTHMQTVKEELLKKSGQ